MTPYDVVHCPAVWENLQGYLVDCAKGCALCHGYASPYNIMRLWADEDEPDEGLEFV